MKRVLLILFLLALASLLGWRIYKRVAERAEEGRPGARRSAAVAVEVGPIQRGRIRDVALFTGSLAAESSFIVAPKISGRLEKLLVDIGDTVQRGQVVATLDAAEYEQAVRQAEAALAVATANAKDAASALDLAERDLKRVTELHEGKIASDADLDAAEGRFKAGQAKLEVAQAQVDQQDAALKSAQVRLSYTRIRADWDGGGDTRVIGERFADMGSTLPANAPIVSVLDLGTLLAVVNVIERDYSQIRNGEEAAVSTDAWPDRTFAGRVERVAPVLREATRQARVEIAVPNIDHLLKPGMFVRARIELARHEDAVLAPLAALVRRNGNQGVFLVEPKESRVRFVPVTVGITEGDRAELVSPELEGQVVTLGQHLLEDGSPVLLPGAKPAAPAGPSAADKAAGAKAGPGGKTTRNAAPNAKPGREEAPGGARP